MARLAFLGLGAMGAPMATRLAGAGHELTVWNRTRAKAEAIEGAARIAGSPADAARGAEAVITMLATPDAVDEVVLGPQGAATAMDAGATLIEMSTIGPDRLAALRGRLPDDIELIDAPVLGSVSNAVDGTLTVYLGGPEEAFDRWRHVLAAMGTPVHLGPAGAGAAMKLVANATLAGLMGLIGEALALADGLGLDEERTLEALRGSPIGPALERKLDKIRTGRYDPSFRLALMAKDLRLVRDAAGARDVELRLVEAAMRWVEQAERDGLADCDYSGVVAEIRGRPADGG